jgi:hypothetical protein
VTNTPYGDRHLTGLRRFALAITALTVLGHTAFGFEASYAQPLVALAAAYGTELLLELIDARRARRRPRFLGGGRALVNFLLAAHISGLAVAMLLYASSQLWPIAFAAIVAIGSKAVFQAPSASGWRHFLNPSNFGITAALLLFPWVGISPPYQFTEEMSGYGDWALQCVIILTGSFLNARCTGRMPLIAAWLGIFVVQALVRSWTFGTPVPAALTPATGVAFLLFTFYMVTDPATTPSSRRGQVAFGAAVGVTYGVLQVAHVVFGLFFALTVVCTLRGCGMYMLALWRAAAGTEPGRVLVPPAAAEPAGVLVAEEPALSGGVAS